MSRAEALASTSGAAAVALFLDTPLAPLYLSTSKSRFTLSILLSIVLTRRTRLRRGVTSPTSDFRRRLGLGDLPPSSIASPASVMLFTRRALLRTLGDFIGGKVDLVGRPNGIAIRIPAEVYSLTVVGPADLGGEIAYKTVSFHDFIDSEARVVLTLKVYV